MVGSSDANLFASISAGICALWGPLHGGANQACVEMLEAHPRRRRQRQEIRRHGQGQEQRLPPDGLRPPRLQELRSARHDHQAHLRQAAGQAAHQRPDLRHRPGAGSKSRCSDPYFIERKLYPNVDFYSGVIYRAMGIPVQMFTVLFAMGRLPGWIAHWMEMHHTPQKNSAARQVYTGSLNPRLTRRLVKGDSGSLPSSSCDWQLPAANASLTSVSLNPAAHRSDCRPWPGP